MSRLLMAGLAARGAEDGALFRRVLGAVTLLVSISVACWVGWSFLATPEGGGARLTGLDREIAAMEQSAGVLARPATFAAGAVCPSVDDGVARFEQRLRRAGSAVGVTLEGLTLTTGAPNEQSGLTPIAASFETTGAYDAVLSFLDSLARSEPTVFVSQADLTPKVSVVTLNFTGRILCWTNARP